MKTADPNQDNVQIFTELHYEINEFMKTFGSLLNAHLIGVRRQRPFCRMSVCEIMTVLIGSKLLAVRKHLFMYVLISESGITGSLRKQPPAAKHQQYGSAVSDCTQS